MNPSVKEYQSCFDRIRALVSEEPDKLHFLIAHFEGFYCSAGNYFLTCMFDNQPVPLEYDLTMLQHKHANLRVLFVALTSPYDFSPSVPPKQSNEDLTHVLKIVVKEPCLDWVNVSQRSIAMLQQFENLITRKDRSLEVPDDLNFIMDFAKVYTNALVEESFKVNFSVKTQSCDLNRRVNLGRGMLSHIKETIYTEPELLEATILAGGLLDITDQDGNTPIMSSTHKCERTTVQRLIEAGADLNYFDNQGQTALMLASKQIYDSHDLTDIAKDLI